MADHVLRYRVVMGQFFATSPMILQVGAGYLDDLGNFVTLSIRNVVLSEADTMAIMAAAPGSGDPVTRYADLTAAMNEVLTGMGAIDAPLV